MPRPDEPLHDFSKVQSGSSSSELPQGDVTQPTYTVQRGDSLSRIAKELYGDASEWRHIFEANRDIITNPDLIHPGQVLRIPQR